MRDSYSTDSNDGDELLTILATQHCRAVLSYFRNLPEEVASVSDLASAIQTESDKGIEQITNRLHHSTLPRLAEAGALEYDVRSSTVRYQGHSELETLAATVSDH